MPMRGESAGLILITLLQAASSLLMCQPEITPISVEQKSGSCEVRIRYDLDESEGRTSTITVSASRDGGGSFIELTSLSGDHGSGVTPGDEKEIIWQADLDWPVGVYSDVTIRLRADQGQPSGIFEMVEVSGGTMLMSMGTETVESFWMGKNEVTWKEWKQIRNWAASNGYDIGEAGEGCGEEYPVHSVTWFDAIKWCNAKSEMEGLTPVYTIGGTTYKRGQEIPVQNTGTSGYRIPLEAEWEFAAWGGNLTHYYNYSGSNVLDWVGWYRDNSGGGACDLVANRGTWPVGQKEANELGLSDMSGNVSEWCWDTPDSSDAYRRIRGGNWDDSDSNCKVFFTREERPDSISTGYGFRLASQTIHNTSSVFDSASFSPFDLDLLEAEPYWLQSTWYGWYHKQDMFWIWHVEHGCQYCPSDSLGSTEGIFIYDLGLQSWIWTSTGLYPFLYKFGENQGWYWYYVGGSPGERWFVRMMDMAFVYEVFMNDPVVTLPDGFVMIPAGVFEMGDPFGEGRRDDLPVHTVSTDVFYMQKTEVTNSQVAEVLNWAIGEGLAVADENNVVSIREKETELLCYYNEEDQFSWDGQQLLVDPGKEDYPAVEITWFGAMAYCHYLTIKEGGLSQAVDLDEWTIDLEATGYRLPTEAEWEKAARGGLEGKRFPTEDTMSHVQANYLSDDRYPYDVSVTRGYHPDWHVESGTSTSPVASFPENGYGLHDMAGNVWEFCYDRYGWDYYMNSPEHNPTGPETGFERIARGGSWYSEAFFLRLAFRGHENWGYSCPMLGFRPVRNVSHAESGAN